MRRQAFIGHDTAAVDEPVVTPRSRAHVVIVTPTLFGAGTGAANHYTHLARWLLQRGHDVEVFSEDVAPGWSHPRLRYHGVLPRRTSTGKTGASAYVAYAVENARLPGVLCGLSKVSADVIVVHSAIANRPLATKRVFERLWRSSRATLVLDVRDVLSKRGVLSAASVCDVVASCGAAVDNMLADMHVPAAKVFRLGVAHTTPRVEDADVARVCQAFALSRPYVIYTGMLKPSKGVDRLCAAFDRLVATRPELAVELVLVGHLKSASPRFLRALERPHIRRLPAQDTTTIMGLVAGSRLHVNPSRSESFGRSTLEALALGVPCIAPAGVPEFAHLGPRFVAAEDVAQLAEQIAAQLDRPAVVPYDVSAHEPHAVFAPLSERVGL